ncbi:MAG: glycosyltransferase family 39 protein [Spirulinaceae cyanobacterium SM2_1_0]|nr:glycosyltransferase family 39 protein [Spirulinaceae cyanobacterium SM2_1_0]
MKQLNLAGWRDRETLALLLLTLAAIALWLGALDNLPLRDWDEGSHAMTAREVYRTGRWLHLTLFDSPYWNKPPFAYWLIAASYALHGAVTEWSARFPLAFTTALGVPLLYGLGREIFSHRWPALLSAATYLTLLPVVRHGRLVMLDGLVNTLFIFLLFCLARSRRQPPWALGIGLALGAITLTKSVLVLALWAIAGLWVLLNRDWALFRNLWAWLGLLLGAGSVAAWYIAQGLHYGPIFWEVHLQAQGLNRLSEAVEGNRGAPWYYLLELGKYAWPWLLFWPGGLWLAWQQRQQAWASLVLGGSVLFLVTISLMGTKLPWYVMPLYPLFALAVGAKLAQFWQHPPTRRLWALPFGLLALGGLVGCGYFVLAEPQPVLMAMAIALVLVMSIVAVQVWRRDRRFIATLLAGSYFCLGLFFQSSAWVWELNEAFAAPPVGALLRTATPARTVVYASFAYNRPSVEFYGDRRVIAAGGPELVTQRQAGHYILVDAPTFAWLDLENPTILGEAAGFRLLAPAESAKP